MKPPVLTVDQALALILDQPPAAASQTIACNHQALGRITAVDHPSQRQHPLTDVSAMDGYALCRADLPPLPAVFALAAGANRAGHAQYRRLPKKQAVRVFTGARIPAGADHVIVQENVTPIAADQIRILKLNADPFIRCAGHDYPAGSLLVAAHTPLNVRRIALLASAHYRCVQVWPSPSVAVLSTGDELVEPGNTDDDQTIPDSNLISLSCLLPLLGAELTYTDRIGDCVDTLAQSLDRLAGKLDLIVTCGGASVGQFDCLKPALKQAGFNILCQQIAMRPGKPVVIARKDRSLLIGLPGNPVSAFVVSLVLIAPYLRAALRQPPDPTLLTAQLNHNLDANGWRQSFLRARVDHPDPPQPRRVTVFDQQDSAFLAPLAQANALVVRPAHQPALNAGELVAVQRFPSPFAWV